MTPVRYVSLALFALTLIVYGQVWQFEFISFDDPLYVSENWRVLSGLTRENFAWAFTTTDAAFWHPLTWLSLMADAELFDDFAGGYHLTNVAIHAANTLLLFLCFQQMTGMLWRSAMIAALFALHPLHVESVAWISERKDVLSTFFGLLALLCYIRYSHRSRPVWIAFATVCLLLSLMSKPMLVTFPFLLLLLDFWPLQRTLAAHKQPRAPSGIPQVAGSHSQSVNRHTWKRLLLEKTPFFVVCLVFCVIAVQAESMSGSVKTMADFPLTLRLQNTLTAYVSYIRKMLWPVDLAVYYPFPNEIPAVHWIAAGLVLVGISLAVVRTRPSRPYLFVGWFWYLGMLVPVLGLVKIGTYRIADRFTYLPLVGLFLLIVWLVADRFMSLRRGFVLPLIAVVALLLMSTLCWRQVATWRNSMSLYEHALSVTDNNDVIQTNIGVELARLQHYAKAEQHLQAAIQIDPSAVYAHASLSLVLASQRKSKASITHAKIAADLSSDRRYLIHAHRKLGMEFERTGEFDAAREHYRSALAIAPSDSLTRSLLEKISR